MRLCRRTLGAPSVRPGHLVSALPRPAGTPERELPLPPPCCPVGLLLQEARSAVLPRLPAPGGARLPSTGQLEGRRDRAGSAVTDRDLATVLPSLRPQDSEVGLGGPPGPSELWRHSHAHFFTLSGLKPESPCLCRQLLLAGVGSSCAVVPGLRRARVSSASLLPPRRPLGDVGVSPNQSRCERPRRAGCRPIEAPAFDFIEGHVGQSLAGRCTGPSGHTGAQAAGRPPRSREHGPGGGS